MDAPFRWRRFRHYGRHRGRCALPTYVFGFSSLCRKANGSPCTGGGTNQQGTVSPGVVTSLTRAGPNADRLLTDPLAILTEGTLAANESPPTIALDEDDDFYLTLSNVAMAMRPGLFDGHSVHWHGFAQATSIFDGLPDASIAVVPGASITYYYKAMDAGTYMYHCHVEAAEHMQMGMLGSLYVRPRQNRTGAGPAVPRARLAGGAASAPCVRRTDRTPSGASCLDGAPAQTFPDAPASSPGIDLLRRIAISLVVKPASNSSPPTISRLPMKVAVKCGNGIPSFVKRPTPWFAYTNFKSPSQKNTPPAMTLRSRVDFGPSVGGARGIRKAHSCGECNQVRQGRRGLTTSIVVRRPGLGRE